MGQSKSLWLYDVVAGVVKDRCVQNLRDSLLPDPETAWTWLAPSKP
jgi:hypothetical protein